MKYGLLSMILAFLSGSLFVLACVLFLLGHDPIPYFILAFIGAVLGFWPDRLNAERAGAEGGEG